MHPNDVLTYAESFRAKLEKKGGPPGHTHIHLYVYTAVDRTRRVLLTLNFNSRCPQTLRSAARCSAAHCAARSSLAQLLLLAALRAARSTARCAARSSPRASILVIVLFSAIFGAKNGDFQNLLKDSKTRANLLFDSGIICGMEPKPCKCQTKNLKTRSFSALRFW